MNSRAKSLVAVIGAGPAGLFASRELALQNVQVALFNRDIKPGGLAEYGIYPDKHKMKAGLRNQFRQILALDLIDYFGNLTIGCDAEISLTELPSLGFQAVLVTAGAQGTKWLGLPGEDLEGVYHAKDLVYHYNRLPPYSNREFDIGRRVALVGVGNVMLDIARYLSTLSQVESIVALARRGPAEVKFSRAELDTVAAQLDPQELQSEIQRVTPVMQSIGQDPAVFMDLARLSMQKTTPGPAKARFSLRFLQSPTRILADSYGRVVGLEVEANTLVIKNGEVKAISLGTHQVLDFDTVIFAIGDQVDDQLCLPIQGAEYVKNPNPRFPIEDTSFELFDPASNCPVEGLFVAGWSRKASYGLVGVARKDGSNGAKVVLQYLQTLPPLANPSLDALYRRLSLTAGPVISKNDLVRLETAESERAQQLGLEEFKFGTNQEMLEAMGLLSEPLPGATGLLRG